MEDSRVRKSENALFNAKLWFGAFYGGLGFIMPYFNLLLKHDGYNGWQLGIISALRPFISAIFGPFWASVADQHSIHRPIFLAAFFVSTVARASLGVVAAPFWYLVAVIAAMEVFSGPVAIMSDTAIVAAALDDGDYGRCRFWACLAWGLAGASGGVLMTYYGDSSAFAAYAVLAVFAGAAAARLDFSFVREPAAWLASSRRGSSAGASLVEPLLHRGSGGNAGRTLALEAAEELLLPVPVSVDGSGSGAGSASGDGSPSALMGGTSLWDAEERHAGWQRVGAGQSPSAIAAQLLDEAARRASEAGAQLEAGPGEGRAGGGADSGAGGPAKRPTTALGRIWFLLSCSAMLTFLTKAFFMGACVGVIDGYLYVYLDALAAPVILLGACLATVCCAELPVFAFSGQILRTLGYEGSLHVALCAFCARLAAYSVLEYLPTLWLVVPVELLHGLTFGIAWSAGINYCKKQAPRGLEATAQGLFSSTYFGLGRGVGGLAGGCLYHYKGPAFLFRACFAWTLLAWAGLSAVEACMVQRAKRRKGAPVAAAS